MTPILSAIFGVILCLSIAVNFLNKVHYKKIDGLLAGVLYLVIALIAIFLPLIITYLASLIIFLEPEQTWWLVIISTLIMMPICLLIVPLVAYLIFKVTLQEQNTMKNPN